MLESMATNKRRKLDNDKANPGSPLMSAFALRRALMRDQILPPPLALAEKVEDGTGATSSLKKADKEGTSQVPKVIPKDDAPRLETFGTESLAPSSSTSRSRTPETALAFEAARRMRVTQLSTFKPNKKNQQQKAGGVTSLKLPEGERLVLLGSYGLKVVGGEVRIVGTTLRAGEGITWIHAPHCHALPVLRCSKDAALELHPHPASNALRKLGSLAPTLFGRLWNDATLIGTRSGKKGAAEKSYKILYTTEDVPSGALVQDLAAPAEWNKHLAALAPSPVKETDNRAVLICGPKSSGKSTFSRLLANRFMTDTDPRVQKTRPGVAILDIDPGQPEFGPPTIISLVYSTMPNLEPPFCHPSPSFGGRGEGIRVLRSHSLAAVSPITDPGHYVECVLDLYGMYSKSLRGKCPLIINSPGWVQGTGLDILTEIMSRIRPAEVVYMSKDGPEETVDGLMEACKQNARFATLPSQAGRFSSRTALQLRHMQMMSYFHLEVCPSILASVTAATAISMGHVQWDATPLTEMAPWRVRFGGPSSGVFGVMCYDFQPGPELLREYLNGMIIAVVEIEDDAAFRDLGHHSATNSRPSGHAMEIDGDDDGASAQQRKQSELPPVVETREGLPLITNPDGATLDPRFSQTVGLALIRAIDVLRKEFLILTPIPAERVAELVTVNGRKLVLVAGKFDPPNWAYTEDKYSEMPISRAVGAGAGMVDDSADASLGDAERNGGGSNGESDIESDYSEHLVVADKFGSGDSDTPWVEVLQANQKRAVGSKVWRVRRDLGRNSGANNAG